jgi:hypothetical protein
MKEHPILFSGPMVQAIIEGRKTMTRRVVKYPTKDGEYGWHPTLGGMQYLPGGSTRPFCPYGQPGDRLWVRETFANINKPGIKPEYIYRADPVEIDEYENDGGKWKPSIHMPRQASRLTLEIVSVRVERLQDISEEYAKSEGVTRLRLSETLNIPRSWVGAFADFWDSINSKRGYSWGSNPWVWVIEFKRIEVER